MEKILKNGFSFIIVFLFCFMAMPLNVVKAEGNQLHIMTDCSSGDNIIYDFDESVDNDSSTILGLTINYLTENSNDFFVIEVNDGATVNLNCFFDESDYAQSIFDSDCGIKLIGKGILNLTIKSNSNIHTGEGWFNYFSADTGLIYVGDENSDLTINLLTDFDSQDEQPISNGINGFESKRLYIKNTKINYNCCGDFYYCTEDVDSEFTEATPQEERTYFGLNNTKINIKFQNLNSYDTNPYKDKILITYMMPSAYGDILFENKSEVKMECLDSSIASADPAFIKGFEDVKLIIDNSSLETKVNCQSCAFQVKEAIIKNGSSLKITDTYYNDQTQCGNDPIKINSLIVINSDIEIESMTHAIVIDDNSWDEENGAGHIYFESNNNNAFKLNVNKEGGSTICSQFGDSDALHKDTDVTLVVNGETKVFSKQDLVEIENNPEKDFDEEMSVEPEDDFDYKITDGNNITIDRHSLNDVLFTSLASISRFVCVKVDGTQLIRDVDYVATDGSTKILLKASYLRTLSQGSHIIEIISTDGSAQTTFKISSSSNGSSSKHYVLNTGVY